MAVDSHRKRYRKREWLLFCPFPVELGDEKIVTFGLSLPFWTMRSSMHLLGRTDLQTQPVGEQSPLGDIHADV
jgi:hypothetical protein